MTVVALVPAKNSASTIAATVQALTSLQYVDQVVVIDDGSTDRTAAVARGAGATVVRHVENEGKGAALATGVAAASGADIYLLVDADTARTASGSEPLVEAVRSTDVDLAIGVLPSAKGRGGFGTVKRFSSRAIERACGLVTEAPLSGQRAIRGDILRRLTLAPRFGVEVAMTIDVARLGGRFEEIAVEMDHAHTGRSLAGFTHRATQGADILRALWPRLVGRKIRSVLG